MSLQSRLKFRTTLPAVRVSASEQERPSFGTTGRLDETDERRIRSLAERCRVAAEAAKECGLTASDLERRLLGGASTLESEWPVSAVVLDIADDLKSAVGSFIPLVAEHLARVGMTFESVALELVQSLPQVSIGVDVISGGGSDVMRGWEAANTAENAGSLETNMRSLEKALDRVLDSVLVVSLVMTSLVSVVLKPERHHSATQDVVRKVDLIAKHNRLLASDAAILAAQTSGSDGGNTASA